MNKLELNIDNSKTYVLACSFGPDSMALLQTAIDSGINVIVAHVNYRKRPESVFEQESLTNFCKNHNIKIEVLDTLNMIAKGNFQEWARELRYSFFADVAKKYNAYGVLVAHQKDDFIETYLMQKKRGNFVRYSGICSENEVKNTRILRPFLNYTKTELQQFNDENGVPYSIDSSNLTDHYTRNKIRHEIVEKMSSEEKDKIVEEAKNNNVNACCFKTKYSIDEFINFDNKTITRILDFYMTKSGEHTDISSKYINEIKKAMLSKPVIGFQITQSVLLEKGYQFVYIINAKHLQSYSNKFSSKIVTDLIDIDFSNGTEDRGFSTNNIELIVKNLSMKDKYNIGNYSCEVRRLFIDWKMPGYLRKIWPGIYNQKGELLYIPRYREKFDDVHKSKFTIKVDYLHKF